MDWIFDSSITMAWCFEDERSSETDALLDRLTAGSPAIVPQIWALEVANVLALAARKNRITRAKRRQFLAMLEAAPISVDILANASIFNNVLLLADQHSLTSYDATYLELAIRLGLPAATLDKPLRKAMEASGVRLL